MYLVGDLSDREVFNGMGIVKVKSQITKDDLAKAKNNSYFQIINLSNLTFFNPEENKWIEFDIESPKGK